MSARKKLYDYIKSRGIGSYSTSELRNIGEVSDWARVMRQLKQDEVLYFNHNSSTHMYEVSIINAYNSTTKRNGLTSKDKYRISLRDGHRCQACGRGVNDSVTLHIDHKIPLEFGGTHNDENLWVLCSDCNQGKKDFFKDDFDSKVMTLVYQQTSGYQKLKVLFENSPGKKFTPSILQGISGIRDWTRTVRTIREQEKMNICWFPATKVNPQGYYMLM